LQLSRRERQWANGGPLFEILAAAYESYLNLPSDQALLPCANGGLALEALARLCDTRRGQRPDDKHRWVVSAFSFKNQGRGYFADARVVDCDERGMLSLAELEALDPSSFDGIVVTNVFGLWHDFEPYLRLARSLDKSLLIDNAAGLKDGVPNWPYQAFSLHHTKPYGVGEGGLALVPRAEREQLADLLGYKGLEHAHAAQWLNNGKLSEIACAWHLDRLERAPEWAPLYGMQATRIRHLAKRAGLEPLFDPHPVHAAMSLPFLVPGEIDVSALANPSVVLGKYYAPLAETPNACRIHHRIVNVPAHPDVANVSEDVLLSELRRVVARGSQ